MSDLTTTNIGGDNADKKKYGLDVDNNEGAEEESIDDGLDHNKNANESNEDDGSWWSLTTSIARSISSQIPSNPTDTAKNAYLGLADVIQRSATAVVAEFAQMEIEAEREARRWRRERGYYSDDEEDETSRNGFPWEVSATEVDEELKVKILALSCDDRTFYGPFDNNATSSSHAESSDVHDKSDTEQVPSFDLDSHVPLIRKLLTIDPNLADAHAKLSGKCACCAMHVCVHAL